jgi:hypothetical protein
MEGEQPPKRMRTLTRTPSPSPPPPLDDIVIMIEGQTSTSSNMMYANDQDVAVKQPPPYARRDSTRSSLCQEDPWKSIGAADQDLPNAPDFTSRDDVIEQKLREFLLRNTLKDIDESPWPEKGEGNG